MLIYICIGILSYLIGNISSSFIISKIFYGADIRTKGSKNAGTTNVLRTYGVKAGALTLLGDYFKGTIAVLLSIFIANQFKVDLDIAKFISIVSVVCGHNWPVFLNFKGGKGVATTYGAMLAIAPLPTLASMLFFIVLVLVTRYVSVASICGVCFFVVLMLMEKDFVGAWICVLLSISVIYKHKDNIKRLLKGEERRLELKKNNRN
ncbi:glycerol-3-phosphate 1-O-acyltransferase PlsY [Peptostreptococcus faecalis]|uniref:glycerol-3-phosphate 1-O-acyltransferase PlsY n=1 Tax=Peptostreptococcus faecalis TaxID=2045015 RepID=UPI000C7E3530|nr:glycerol-3-phosphate 1-O-acyltransferase PlsY [Peptostreptococcus faecalis]